MFLTLIIFILVLSVLVFVHELGHFLAARNFGVRVEEFGFGFQPRLCGIYRVNRSHHWWQFWKHYKHWKIVFGNKEIKDAEGTVYSINWLPLGGFCVIKGENGEGENDRDSFVSKKIWQRIIIISAGVIMNIVLAAFLFSIGYMIGLPQGLEGVDKNVIVRDQKVLVLEVLPNTPAASSGVKAGDAILEIDGQKFSGEESLRAYVNTRAGQKLDYKIERNKEILDLKIIPNNNNGKGEIGVAIANTGLVRYPWYLAIWKGVSASIIMVWAVILAFYDLLKNLIIGQGVSANIAGPVGIASLTGQYARLGVVYLLQFVGLLSVNLAVVNFLPLPALDGGRIIFLLIEKIKGKPVKREIEAIIHSLGFFLLILLVILVTVHDLSRFTGSFKILLGKIF